MVLKKPKREPEEDEEESEEEELEEVEDIEEEQPKMQQQIKKEINKPVASAKPKDANVRYVMVEVPVQMTTAFQDTETEKIYDQNQMLLKIANDIEEIKKSVA